MSLPVLSDSLQSYLVQINQVPLLTKDEEFDLAVRYSEHNDISAAHKLVTANLRFVVKIAIEYKGYIAQQTEHAIKLIDLIQEGNIGLMKAVKRFNPHKGYRLITYAVWWIRAQIQQFILKALSIVKRSSSELRKVLFSQFDKSREMIEKITGETELSFADAYNSLNMNNLDALQGDIPSPSSQRNLHHISLDKEVGENGEATFLDYLHDTSSDQENALSIKEEQSLAKKRLHTALRALNPKEKSIICERFLIDKPLTLQEIGNKLGVTRERVRQIESKALKKLKERL